MQTPDNPETSKIIEEDAAMQSIEEKYKSALAELGGYSIKDEKNDAIPRTPAERRADREADAWLKKEMTRRRVRKHRKGSM